MVRVERALSEFAAGVWVELAYVKWLVVLISPELADGLGLRRAAHVRPLLLRQYKQFPLRHCHS